MLLGWCVVCGRGMGGLGGKKLGQKQQRDETGSSE